MAHLCVCYSFEIGFRSFVSFCINFTTSPPPTKLADFIVFWVCKTLTSSHSFSNGLGRVTWPVDVRPCCHSHREWTAGPGRERPSVECVGSATGVLFSLYHLASNTLGFGSFWSLVVIRFPRLDSHGWVLEFIMVSIGEVSASPLWLA